MLLVLNLEECNRCTVLSRPQDVLHLHFKQSCCPSDEGYKKVVSKIVVATNVRVCQTFTKIRYSVFSSSACTFKSKVTTLLIPILSFGINIYVRFSILELVQYDKNWNWNFSFNTNVYKNNFGSTSLV